MMTIILLMYNSPTHGGCKYHLMLCAHLLVFLMPAFYHGKIWHEHLKQHPVHCVHTLSTVMTVFCQD